MKENKFSAKATKTDILFFSEDPGAANYLVSLPDACKKKGFSSASIVAGKAEDLYKERNVSCIPAESFSSAAHVLDTFHTRLLVVGTSENRDSLGLNLVTEAKKRGDIRTVGAVDAFMNAGHRFKGTTIDPLAYAPEWLMVPDIWVQKEFTGMGFNSDKVVICGHPQYDFVKETSETLAEKGKSSLRNHFFPDIKKSQIVAVFAAEQHGGLNSEQFIKSDEYTLQGDGGTTRNEIVLEEFLIAINTLKKRPYLVLRLHPNSQSEEFEPYLESFDMVSHEEPVLELLYASDCVFGMTTMLLMEAAILKKPTFSILPREIESDWLPTIRNGMTACATTRDAIKKMFSEHFHDTAFSIKEPDSYFVFGATRKALTLFESLLITANSS